MKNSFLQGVKPLIICILFALQLISLPAFSQKKNESDAPKWLDRAYRESHFADSKYVQGFTSEQTNSSETTEEELTRLKNYSRTQLVESIYVSIKSIVATDIITENTNTTSLFRQTSVSLSKVNITGLTEDVYYDEKERMCYAFSYASKADISASYRTTIANKKAEVDKKVKAAEEYVKNKDQQNALKSYFECFPIFREIEESQTLIIAFENLPESAPELFVDAINDLKVKVNTGLKGLKQNEQLTLDDACLFMSYGLKLQIPKDFLDKSIRLDNFTFQDSKTASPFSKRFAATFEQKLISQSLTITNQPNTVLTDDQKKDDSFFIGGTYWEDGSNIKIIANMRAADGKAIASVEGYIPITWFTANNVAYKPENYNQVLSNLATFNQDLVISSGGLVIDVSTNKGADDLIFTEDDSLKFYVRTNKSCYLRFVYFLADGQKVLLLPDNYYIATDMVNKIIEIPEVLICSAPFGVENLQLTAQSQKFAPLGTQEQDGYTFITDDTKKIVSSTRGFKPKNNADAKAEKLMIFTTMKK